MENERDEFLEYEEINLIQYVNVLLKRRWLIVLGAFLSTVLAGVISLSTPPKYTARARFIPSKNPEMTARMGTLVGSGSIETFGENVTSEYYAEILKSTSFLERIVEKKFFSREIGEEVDLIALFEITANSDTEKSLMGIDRIAEEIGVSTDRTTKIVSISFTTKEPELSAAIVNSFLDELIQYNQDIINSKAKLNREFVEAQLKDALRLLKDAETELADFTARNKKIATPDLQLDQDRMKRNLKVQEEVYITLSKQLELAKIEEQEQSPMIEILDRATPPVRKSSPKIKRNVILAGFVSLILFIGLAFIIEYISKLNRNDEKYREFYQNLDDIKKDFSRIIHPFRK
jgi:uncharacterized protein involved in exopolysaccharide biosynthesis